MELTLLRKRLLSSPLADLQLMSKYHTFFRWRGISDRGSLYTHFMCRCGLKLTQPDRWWTQARINGYEQDGRLIEESQKHGGKHGED